MASKIAVPKILLVGLAGVAAAAVLGVVFLLGRASGRTPPPSPPSAPYGAPPAAPSAPAPAQEFPAQAAPPGTAPSQAVPARPPAPVPGVVPAPPGDPDRPGVIAYFKAVDQIQPGPSGAPEAVAQQLVAGLVKGDTSGFDDMVRQARETRDRVAALTPPRPCVAYHQESLAILDGGLELMRAIKRGLSASDPSTQSTDISDTAKALKARSEALQLQERVLRQRYHD